MKADLHVHSDYSDGADSVEDVLDAALEKGITTISFVDHDTTDPYTHAQEAGRARGIQVIPGIEISAYDFKRNRKVHILGYDYRPAASHIKELCAELLERRNRHSWKQVETLNQNGYHIDPKQLRTSLGGILYKQHIMDALTDAPYESTFYSELYRKLFKGEGICAGDIEYIDAHLAVRAIKADGGIPVLAHPGQLNSFDLVPELLKSGLAGIELEHPDHTEADRERVQELAEHYDLMMTGGSDYHGRYWIPVELGDGSTQRESVL